MSKTRELWRTYADCFNKAEDAMESADKTGDVFYHHAMRMEEELSRLERVCEQHEGERECCFRLKAAAEERAAELQQQVDGLSQQRAEMHRRAQAAEGRADKAEGHYQRVLEQNEALMHAFRHPHTSRTKNGIKIDFGEHQGHRYTYFTCDPNRAERVRELEEQLEVFKDAGGDYANAMEENAQLRKAVAVADALISLAHSSVEKCKAKQTELEALAETLADQHAAEVDRADELQAQLEKSISLETYRAALENLLGMASTHFHTQLAQVRIRDEIRHIDNGEPVQLGAV